MKETIESRIRKRIFSRGRGWVFTPANFFDCGERSSVDKALSRLTEKKVIRRLARGIYDYPVVHEVLGELAPELEQLAQVLKTKNAAKLQASDAYAAYLLGLTEQVPMKVVFLTDGTSRQFKIKGHHLTLKHTTPKNLATAGRISGTVFQALRWLGKDHVDQKMIDLLKERLTDVDKNLLLQDLGLVPAWVGNAFREIAKTSTKESGFDKFITLDENEKRVYLNEASSRCGLPAGALEKDFWVCWLLDVLFHLPEIGQHLTFKGGTSLFLRIQAFFRFHRIVICELRSKLSLERGRITGPRPRHRSFLTWRKSCLTSETQPCGREFFGPRELSGKRRPCCMKKTKGLIAKRERRACPGTYTMFGP